MFIEVTNYESPGKVLINVNSITSISDAHHATAKSAIVVAAGTDDDGVYREKSVLHRGLFKESYASLRGALARNGQIVNVEDHL